MESKRLKPCLVTCILLCALMTGCGDADVLNGAREVLPDGSVIISYTDLSEAPLDTLSVDLAIGRASGEEWETFGSIAGLAVDHDGSIHVLDFQARAVRVFESDGRFRTTFGRVGDGPGEFRQPTGLIPGPDGTVWVRDQGTGRVMVMSHDGRELEAYALPSSGSASAEWDAVIDEQGRLWQSWSHRGSVPPPQTLTGLDEVPRRVYARSFDPNTGEADSVLVAETTARFVRWPQGPGYASAGVPFDPQPLVAMDLFGNLWSASSEAYRVRRLAGTGTTALVIQVAAEGPLVPEQQRAGWVSLMNQAQADIEVPERLPTLVRILTDDRELLWVQRRAAPGELAQLDAFNGAGQFLGSVRLAAQLAPSPRPVIRGGHLHAVALTDLDVPQVVKAPLPRWAR